VARPDKVTFGPGGGQNEQRWVACCLGDGAAAGALLPSLLRPTIPPLALLAARTRTTLVADDLAAPLAPTTRGDLRVAGLTVIGFSIEHWTGWLRGACP
jgi:hypothetical protein